MNSRKAASTSCFVRIERIVFNTVFVVRNHHYHLQYWCIVAKLYLSNCKMPNEMGTIFNTDGLPEWLTDWLTDWLYFNKTKVRRVCNAKVQNEIFKGNVTGIRSYKLCGKFVIPFCYYYLRETKRSWSIFLIQKGGYKEVENILCQLFCDIHCMWRLLVWNYQSESDCVDMDIGFLSWSYYCRCVGLLSGC